MYTYAWCQVSQSRIPSHTPANNAHTSSTCISPEYNGLMSENREVHDDNKRSDWTKNNDPNKPYAFSGYATILRAGLHPPISGQVCFFDGEFLLDLSDPLVQVFLCVYGVLWSWFLMTWTLWTLRNNGFWRNGISITLQGSDRWTIWIINLYQHDTYNR